jgi:uncharacterized membrane protein
MGRPRYGVPLPCARVENHPDCAGWRWFSGMAAPVHLLSALVFLVFLLRHALSWALALYPGEGWLWRLSLSYGYDLLPALSLLRDGLNLGFVGTFAVLAGLSMAAYARNLFVALLVLHIATFACGYCCLIAVLRHPLAADIGVPSFKIAAVSATLSPLQVLCLGLMLACGYGHWRYLKSLRDRSSRGGIIGA